MARILVINPNSSASVTAAVDAAVVPLHLRDGPAIDCVTLAEAGRALVRECRADVLMLGCAGMARHRATVAAAAGCPVVEPSQQAVAAAVGALLLEPRNAA